MSLPVKPDCRMYDFAGGAVTVCRIRAHRVRWLPALASREGVWSARQYIDMEGERQAAGDGRIDSPEGFEAAFVRLFPPVYRFLAARVGPAVAEDLAAERVLCK